MATSYEQLEITSAEEWRDWLDRNHDGVDGVWLVTYKKSEGDLHVPYDDIVRHALSYGWVDSRPRKLDERRSQLLVTRRKPRSKWSAANKKRVAELSRAGLMHPAGEEAIAQAKKSGTWTALDKVEALDEPDDLRAALDSTEPARRHWDAFPPSTRRAILEWIESAKRPATREKRITETAAKASENVRANQWRQPKGS